MFKCCRTGKLNRISEIGDISYVELQRRAKLGAILLDVRSLQEYEEGHLEGAILVPDYEIEKKIEKVLPNKNKEIIIYCKSGNRSRKAYRIMKQKGYNNIYNLKGGINYI